MRPDENVGNKVLKKKKKDKKMQLDAKTVSNMVIESNTNIREYYTPKKE